VKDHTERLLCPLPLAIDTYRGCSTGCAYCSLNGLRTGIKCGSEVSPNSVKYVEKFFYRHKISMEKRLIDQRCPVQVGVSADPLQPIEKQHRVTLRVLKILQDREYPTVITTKYPTQLVEDDYLRALDGLPLVIQCSISTADKGLLKRLEPCAPSLVERMRALRTLLDAGVHVQFRLWPFAPDLCGNVAELLAMAKDAGARTVLANPLKVYHAGGSRELLNTALGRDYLATSPLRYDNHGVFSVASYEDQVRGLSKLQGLCRKYDMQLLTGDDYILTREWRTCCGIDDLPGFEGFAKWAYLVNGWRISQHTDFETYMHRLECPWREEFEQEWDKGKLAEIMPELLFHDEDKTYSRFKQCVPHQEKAESSAAVCPEP